MGNDLTKRQQAFVREYLLSRNGADAARKAGYSEAGADVAASRLIRNPRVQAEIEAAEKKVQEANGITHQKIIDELSAIAFGHAGMVMKWTEGSVSFIPKDQLDERAMKFISAMGESTSEGGGSLTMKTMASEKVKALELLGKHIGMFKPERDTSNATSITLNYSLPVPKGEAK